MGMREALDVGSRVLFASAGVLFVVALRYALAHDLKGVLDDLSGRRRQRGIEEDRKAKRAKRGSAEETMRSYAQEMLTEMAEPLVESASIAPTVVDAAGREQSGRKAKGVEREVVLCGSTHVVGEGGVLL